MRQLSAGRLHRSAVCIMLKAVREHIVITTITMLRRQLTRTHLLEIIMERKINPTMQEVTSAVRAHHAVQAARS
jgi:hypothetical protein